KATAGGYQHACNAHAPRLRAGLLGWHGFSTIQVDACFLDPEFWRALGHTLGWDHERVWQGSWPGFLDHVAHGNTPASFFAALRDPATGVSPAGGHPMRSERDPYLDRASQRMQALQKTLHHLYASAQQAHARAHSLCQTAQVICEQCQRTRHIRAMMRQVLHG